MVLIGEGNEGRRLSGDLVGLWGEEGGGNGDLMALIGGGG